MKKVFFVLVCVVAMGATLVSCDKDKACCWEVYYTMNDEAKTTEHIFKWMSPNNMDTQKATWEKNYTDVKVTKVTKYKTQEECDAQNTSKAK